MPAVLLRRVSLLQVEHLAIAQAASHTKLISQTYVYLVGQLA